MAGYGFVLGRFSYFWKVKCQSCKWVDNSIEVRPVTCSFEGSDMSFVMSRKSERCFSYLSILNTIKVRRAS